MNHETVTKSLERLEQKVYRAPAYHYPGEKYAYVFGHTKGGKTFCDGPFAPSDPQIERLTSRLENFEVFYYNTRDLSAATRQLKAELLNRGEDIDETLKRMLHKKGFEHEEKKSTLKSLFGVRVL